MNMKFSALMIITIWLAIALISGAAWGHDLEPVPIGKVTAVNPSTDHSGDSGTSVKLGGIGLIGDGEMAGIEWSVTRPGFLEFDWKVSSEQDYDVLRFYEVGLGETNRISGTGVGWTRVSIVVSGDAETGHTLRWEYEKDPIGDYVGDDAGWVDAITWTQGFILVVDAGNGDGLYTNDTPVSISADVPAPHYEFDRWTGDTNGVADVLSASTTLTMPFANVVLAATYKPVLYPLTVVNGSGSGGYPYGSHVEISASDLPGKQFYRWSGDVEFVASDISAATTATMPDVPVSVAATYYVPLTVNDGSGSGWHPEGSVVKVMADPDPLYMEFASWTGDAVEFLEDASSPTTMLTMPTTAGNLTATYRDSIARVSGSYGRTYTRSGTENGISTDAAAGAPSENAAVKLGGAGVVPDNGFVAFETVVQGSGSVTFWWKSSSEVNDYLKFLVDGIQMSAISGTKSPWTGVSNRVEGAGVEHTLRWEYVKNGSTASSIDAVWVDDIVWIGDVLMPVLAPEISDITLGETEIKVTFWGERGIPYGVSSNPTLNGVNWSPMEEIPQEIGESNGVFKYQVSFIPPAQQVMGFYRAMSRGSRVLLLIGDLDFGAVRVWTEATQNLVIVNDGNMDLHVSGISLPQGFHGDWSGAITPGASQVVPITFSPQVSQFYSGNIEVISDATSGVNTMLVAGNGVFAPTAGMVLIPGGTNSGTDPDYHEYSLTITSIYMDKTEVTKAKWDEVYNWAIARGYAFDKAGFGNATNHPVHTINWYDMVKWCNARSEKEGCSAVYTVGGAVYKTGRSDNVVQTSATGYRLPTEVEWEYSARGGVANRRFPWGNTITHSQANYVSSATASYDTSPTRGYHPDYDDGAKPYTSPVGSFAVNGYGLYDMAGNVEEWCFDWHPTFVGTYRVFRGGSWARNVYGCRVADRDYDLPGFATSYIGFRAVLPAQ